MTHRNVELLIGRLATDVDLRRRFAHEPDTVLAEFQQQGFELTRIEIDALLQTDVDAIRAFTERLDRRIRRLGRQSEPDLPAD